MNREMLLSVLVAVLVAAGVMGIAVAASEDWQTLQGGFDCSAVTEVPQVECEALVALYNSTSGDNWTNNTDWLTTITPCTWNGVTCAAGHVTELTLPSNQLSGSIPLELSDLSELTSLNLAFNQLIGAIPTEIGSLANLTVLDFGSNQLSGSIPAELGGLTSLLELKLAGNDLGGSIPPALGDLANLQILHIGDNALTGGIPPELGNLSNLTELWLRGNALTGNIPVELGGLGSLEVLELSFNQLSGTIPAELGNLSSVSTLILSVNDFVGGIPPALGNLTNLQVLHLGANALTGSIPAELGGLTSLVELRLDGNSLSGGIPPALGNLGNLELLQISFNQLSGGIPPELGQLGALITLDLAYNQLSGTIPAQIANLANLQVLGLLNNQLSGGIPASLANLSNLTILTLRGNNLSGNIPVELGGLGSLEALDLSFNLLSGNIPSEVGNLGSLTYLNLAANDLTGGIPPALGNLTNLQDLHLWSNTLTGSIPPELGGLSNLVEVRLDNNSLSGGIPSQLGDLSNLEHLRLGDNQLDGSIPSTLGNLSQLTYLEISSTELTGNIPPELGNLSALVHLQLDFNQLTGGIPAELGNLSNLETLDLEDNQLSGSIPPELGNLSSLVSLVLFGNQLTGSIPSQFGNLSNLERLDLGENQLDGSIPSVLGNLSQLTYLELGTNQLTGSIPSSLGNLTNLEYLWLDDNQLTGGIPSALGNLSNLWALGVSGNQLTGSIPPELGNLTNLNQLSLNGNQLSGGVPSELGNMSNLRYLSVENNPLSGPLPLSLQNLDLQQFHFFNTDLCEPDDPGFQAWLDSIPELMGTGVVCVSATSTPTPGPTTTPTATPTPAPTQPPPTPEPDRPLVQEVRSCFIGPFFVQGTSLPNRYDAFVDWQGTPSDYVDFTLNGSATQETFSGNPTSHTYDMGYDLRYGLLGTRNTLDVHAVSADGESSPAYSLYPIGIWAPTWIPVQPAVLDLGCVEGGAKYQWSLVFPDPPFEGQVTPPNWFPFIGGDPFGVQETQGSFKLTIASDGVGSFKGSGKTGFDVAGQGVIGTLYGKGDFPLQQGEPIKLSQALLGLQLSGKITAERPVIDVICKAFTGGVCPLQEAESLPVVGGIIRQFNEKAKIEARVKPSVNAEAVFGSTASGWQWESIRGGGKVRMTLALILDIFKDLLTAEAYGGGEPSITLQVPPDPSLLKEVAAELFAGIKIKIWRFANEFEAAYQWTYAPDGASRVNFQPGNLRYLSESGWYPISREYADGPAAYADFRANEDPLHLAGEIENLLHQEILTLEENLIVANIFPDSHPAIAVGGNTLLLWVHDDTSKPLMQGEEIQYALYDGISWKTPVGITNDNLQDFAPQVANTGGNTAVAVWERNNTVQSESSELNATYTRAFEIAYATWDGVSWSAPAYLTDNNNLDHTPVLAQGNDGTPVLVWRQNAAGELIGTPTNPDQIYYTIWNGTGWEIPEVLLNDIQGVSELAAARHESGTMAVAYSQDTDGDLSTTTDQELFLVTWDGIDWSEPAQLTGDQEADASPALFYDASGNPRLLWLKGESLYALIGDLNSTPQPIVLEDSAALLDYAVAQDTNGNLVLLWQGLSEEGVDVFYATYDEQHQVFSLVEQLTHDEPLEKFMAPAFAPTGELLMAYGKDELITTTVEVSSTLMISNVTTFGQSDLYVLRHTFGPDLAVEVADLAIEPANPAPGSTAQVSVTLHNLGDRAIVNPEVAFYHGDPTSGGTLIMLIPANLTMAGGMTTTISADWSLPPTGGPFDLYAVADPNGTITELDENNNQAHIPVAVPDLVVQDVWMRYGAEQTITATARISNTGVSEVLSVPVSLRLNDPITGTELARTTISNLAPGAVTDVPIIWDASPLTTGWHSVYAVADPDDTHPEADESNNDAWASAGILPDLSLRSTAVITGINTDGTQSASVWVFNQGVRAAENVTLGLYRQLPAAGTVPIVSTSLSVSAGEFRVTTLNLGTYPYGFFAGVGMGSEMGDRDVSDNILQVGKIPKFIYLPFIIR